MRTVIPGVKKTKEDPCDCPSFLPKGVFGVMEQGGKTQAQHSSLTKLQGRRLEFRKPEAAVFCRTEHQSKELHRKRTPEVCIRVSLSLCCIVS